jgi:hypothetical protein
VERVEQTLASDLLKRSITFSTSSSGIKSLVDNFKPLHSTVQCHTVQCHTEALCPSFDLKCDLIVYREMKTFFGTHGLQ